MIVKFKHKGSKRSFYVDSARVCSISDETYISDDPCTRVWMTCGEYFDVGYLVDDVRNMLQWDK